MNLRNIQNYRQPIVAIVKLTLMICYNGNKNYKNKDNKNYNKNNRSKNKDILLNLS